MRTLIAAMLLGLAACPPNPGPQPPPFKPTSADGAAMDICPTNLLVPPRPSDVCEGMFTSTGWACVNCAGAAGCMDSVDGVYCSNGPCLSDPLCQKRPLAAPRK